MRLLITFFFSIFSFIALSQQPPCGNNPQAGNTCADAVEICDLNGYCGNTSSSYTVNSWSKSCGFLGLGDCGLTGEFCGSIENNSFIKFTADASTVNLEVWVGNCSTGQGIQIMVFKSVNFCSGEVTSRYLEVWVGNCSTGQGIQIMVFKSVNFCSGEVTSYYCNGQFSPSPNMQSISITGLTPGETYYLMVDGFAGDVCDYTFIANSGVSVPVSIDPDETTLCLGESVTLTASGGDGTYTWDASPGLGATTGATVTVTPPLTPGTYTYTAHSNATTSCLNATTATSTVVVEACGCPLTTSNSGSVCEGDPFSLTANLASGNMTSYSWSGPFGFSSTDQNPTGIPAPPAGTHDYTFTATIDGVLCTSTTTLTVNDCSGGCDVDAIRTAFTNAGCIELDACVSDCSMYFLNHNRCQEVLHKLLLKV